MTTKLQFNLQLDFHSGLPIYIQIVEQLQKRIVSGTLKPGTQLPTVRALAEELRVNFNTVARAYRILDEARIISTQQGRGTYITDVPPPEVSERLRRESLVALSRSYIRESIRLGFSGREMSQMVNDQLRSWQEADNKDTE